MLNILPLYIVCIFNRPYSWIKSMNMGAFVSVAKGSVEEPYLLEVKYSGDPESQSCIALVGKG